MVPGRIACAESGAECRPFRLFSGYNPWRKYLRYIGQIQSGQCRNSL